MSALVPCPSCNRHVRAGESACPFCSASLSHPACEGRCSSAHGRRLSRAALFAMGGAALLGAACGSGVVAPPYGAPPPPPDSSAATDAPADRADSGAGSNPDGGQGQ
jgi:hypothetical protein